MAKICQNCPVPWAKNHLLGLASWIMWWHATFAGSLASCYGCHNGQGLDLQGCRATIECRKHSETMNRKTQCHKLNLPIQGWFICSNHQNGDDLGWFMIWCYHIIVFFIFTVFIWRCFFGIIILLLSLLLLLSFIIIVFYVFFFFGLMCSKT